LDLPAAIAEDDRVIVDARQLADGSQLASHVCIVGAGPAGTTIACELAGTPWRVCLVESGGLDVDAGAQTLAGPAHDGDFFPPASAFHRQLGGVANVWNVRITEAGGGCRFVPLDPIDFEPRDWVPSSGWPLSRDDLEPYYPRALRVCGVDDGSYRLDDWVSASRPALPFDPARITTSIEHFGQADVFTRDAPAALERAANVDILIHATVTALEEDGVGPAVTRVRLVTASGREHTIAATLFVIAAGGVENPRLLLLSNASRSAGLGNHHDLVGRFFMDHHNVRAGFLVPTSRRLLETADLYDLRLVRGKPIMGKLRIAERLMREARLLNAAVRLQPGQALHRIRAVGSLRRVRRDGLDGPRDAVPIARDVVADSPRLAVAALRALAPRARRGFYGWSELRAKRWRFDGFNVEIQVEHAPDPANRVVLGRERDPLGLPRAAIHWRWGSVDLDSLGRVQAILAEECARAGLGRLELSPSDVDPTVTAPGGIHHHMGTTRMHADERHGVVDADCRVHGVPNLFVAGSSVFPTGGYANPTLTIVALAIRLADHLKVLMARSA
jgi:choline dehydrogenase-like flavoprotein